ncbi:MAG: type II toxin-antitoxin system VapC family toxin [Lentisphaeraceae bacterium]|nr:type II toxin-antitoxin system VapC family toxin [Lentisphaeraceae bacterium]
MKRYLLDTNSAIDLFSDNSSEQSKFDVIISHIEKLNEEDELSISIMTVYELYYAKHKAPKSLKKQAQRRINKTKAAVNSVLSFPDETKADLFGKIKADYVRKNGLNKNNSKKHVTDIILAVTALQNDCILVSADKIFDEIHEIEPRLKWENWTV